MALPTKHIVHQGRVLASLGGTALAAVMQRWQKPAGPMQTPTPELHETIAPLPADLIADYVRFVGGDAGAYKKALPPHLFPQWGFPLAARTLKGIPYPMAKVLNGGCRLEINGPLPVGEKLDVRARLEDIDDDGRRAVLHQRVVTGTRENPEALVAHMYAIVPVEQKPDPAAAAAPGGGKQNGKNGKAKKNGSAGPARPKKDAPRVPDGARELAFWKIPADAGLAFAMLTGDFNPVHWVRPYAKAFGFRSTILHGFATMARAYEGLVRSRFSGDATRLRTFDVKFTRPLILPARVGLYINDHQIFVGDAPGGPAYLTGSFEER